MYDHLHRFDLILSSDLVSWTELDHTGVATNVVVEEHILVSITDKPHYYLKKTSYKMMFLSVSGV